ncbi:hypothetical protein Q8F55_007639 [Vanrija albida]|uniref:Uncharacterized protein n=1 Tax=Vanrija albida TaxID=181172 RepID=A0ABR3PU32_9TREE
MVATSRRSTSTTRSASTTTAAPPTPRKHIVFLELTRQEHVMLTFLDVSIPDGTTHLVLTLTYDPTLDPRLPADARCPCPDLEDSVTDVTVIIKSVFMASRRRSPPAAAGEIAVLQILLAFVGANTIPGRRFTLVGVHDVDWRWLGAAARPLHTVNTATATIQAHYRDACAWTCAELRSVVGGLVFTPLGRYRCEEEDEEYKENTVCPSSWRARGGVGEGRPWI